MSSVLTVERIARIPGIEDVAMTTNGILLPGLAPALRRAGLRQAAHVFGKRARVERRVDRVTAIFIPVVLALAVATLL